MTNKKGKKGKIRAGYVHIVTLEAPTTRNPFRSRDERDPVFYFRIMFGELGLTLDDVEQRPDKVIYTYSTLKRFADQAMADVDEYLDQLEGLKD